MTTLMTVLRGLRSRALLSLTSLAMMVLAVSGAVLGPMFQLAATESYTLTRLDEAPDAVTALSWEAASDRVTDLDILLADAADEVSARQPREYAEPQVYVLTDRMTRDFDGAEVRYLAREDVCAHLEVEGRCPEVPGEVLVLEADLQGRALGDTVEGPRLGDLTIVGSYRTPSETRDWLFPSLFTSQPPTETSPYEPAPYVVTQDVVAAMPPGLWSPQLESRLVVPDRIDESELDDLVAQTELLRTETVAFGGGVLTGTADGNALGSVLDDVRGQRAAARAALAPAVVSLVLVALAMILRLQLAAAELRGPELALASLRGLGTRKAWLLGLAEPWLLAVLSVPLGVVGGYAATGALARSWLRDDTNLDLPTVSVVAAAGVGVAVLLIAAAAVARGLRETLGARLTGLSRPRASGRAVLVAELVVVLLAATLPLSVLGSDGGGLGVADLLLPVAAAVAAGLLMTRAVTAVAVRWTARAAERPLPVFVAARAVARRTQGTLVILPVCAAIAVSVFAVGIDSAAGAWRGSVAATTAPGDEVYSTSRLLDETLHLTHELDPEGRYLMAVSRVSVPGAGGLVAVDAPRLGRVADWPEQWLDGRTGADAGAEIAPAVPVVRMVGDRIDVTTEEDLGEAVVVLGLRTPAGLRSIDVTADGKETEACVAGCFLVSLSTRGDEPVTVTGLAVDGAPVAELGEPVTLQPGEPHLVPAAADPIPAVVGVGENGELLDAGVLETASTELRVRTVGTAESLPIVGPAGLMVDLTTFVMQADPAPILVLSYVVMRADTPEAIRSGLAGSGLVRQPGAAETRRVLDGTAYAQALRLYLVVAVTLLLMALGGLVVSNAVQMPARRRDAAALRVVGVGRRSLVLASLAESVVVLGAAAVAGLVAGALSLAVLLPSLELGVVDDARTPRVLPDADVGRLVVVAAGVAAVLLVVAVVTSVAVVRRARAATLRETAG